MQRLVLLSGLCRETTVRMIEAVKTGKEWLVLLLGLCRETTDRMNEVVRGLKNKEGVITSAAAWANLDDE